MICRPATLVDHGAVEAIWREQNRLHAELEADVLRAAGPLMTEARFTEILADPLQEIAVAGEGDGVVAAAWLVERRTGSELLAAHPVAFVHEICVLEAHRRRGIGRQLAGYIQEWARSRDLDRIELNVWGRNEAALAFYRSLDFRIRRYELERPV